MTVSGVYARITNTAQAAESSLVANNAAATPAAFKLSGGTYALAVVGTFATATLQLLGPDGSTYITNGTSWQLSAVGVIVITVPAGTYKLVLA